jgi:hypothetical protein
MAFVVTGMAYTFWWPLLVRHNRTYWLTPGDIWPTLRLAHFVQWGDLSYVYLFNYPIVTLPGFNVLLAPFAALSAALNLTEMAPGGFPFKPEAWLLIGPFCFAVAGVGLFACDALARRIGAGVTARRILLVAEAAAFWPAVVMWGHPEDVLALGLALYALSALSDDRPILAGWLLGFALSMQLFVVLLVPIFIGVTGIRKAKDLLLRAIVIPGFLLVAVLAPDFHDAFLRLTKQPGYPTILHPTPWIHLAPHISRIEVSSGPVHLLTVVVAVGMGFLAHRWRHDWPSIFWLMAVAAGIRSFFEPVMAPYYVMPAVAIAFGVGAARGRVRSILTLASGLGLTVMTFSHSNEWTYWLEMVGLMGAMFFSARPPTPELTEAESGGVDGPDGAMSTAHG